MADATSRWQDLGVRVGSGAAMIALTLVALFGHEGLWPIFVQVVIVLSFRELARLCEPDIHWGRRWFLALLPFASWVAAPHLMGLLPGDGILTGLATVYAPVALIGLLVLRAGRLIWLGYALLLLMCATGLNLLGTRGPEWPLALILLIAASDVAGYFVGRYAGGPKFWPRVSPKKTWSGTIGGWIASGLFALVALPWLMDQDFSFNAGLLLGVFAAGAALSFAGQMGDIAESAMKRRAGLKDSSALIPGHGGVLDRIDALVAASALVFLIVILGG